MPLQTILLNAGVNAQITDTLGMATITSSQLIRFKPAANMVLVEKMGGWIKYYPAPIGVGSPVRELHAWVDLAATTHLGIGSEQNLTVITSGSQNDVTPFTQIDNVAVSFSTTNGSKVVTITDASITASTLDTIWINTPVAVGGLLLQGAYAVTLVPSSSTFNIAAASNATSTVTNGGAVPTFSTVITSASVNVLMTGHGLSVGSNFSVPTPTSVGGLTLSGAYLVQTVVDANNFTINATFSASSTGSASMNGGNVQIIYYITQAPIQPAAGYGVGPYGSGGYGIGTAPLASSGTALVTTNWTLDNWGEILMACPVNGSIYRWAPDGGYTSAVRVMTSPLTNGGIFMSNPYQILVAWGSSLNGVQDPLLIAWSTSGDYTVWVATSQNQAGTYRIPSGSKIMGALQGPQFGFVWTDVDVWAMQYIQPPFVFGFNKLAAECGLIARHAAGVVNSTVYWMGQNAFFQYAGAGVQPIVCTVWDIVFQDMDWSNTAKIYCGTNNGFGEVMWFFPSLSGGTGDVDSYVKYNFILNCWDYGRLNRTAWLDQSLLGQPIGGNSTGYVYQHEVANDADGTPMGEYFQTGYSQISQGEEMTFLDWLIPDMTWGKQGASNPIGAVNITLLYTDYPNNIPKVKGPYQVNNLILYRNPRVRGRSIAMRIDGVGLGGWWRIGALRWRGAPDGKR